MKKIFCLFLIFNFLSIIGFSQDRIIKVTRDTIRCQIKEIGDDEVKYTLKDFQGDLIFGLDKNKISRIILSDGKELTFEDSMYGLKQYEQQHKNALKVGFLSPLFGATSFTFERSLKPGSSWEATLGIIGLGTDLGDNKPEGTYLKLGYKIINRPDFYRRGTHFDHILKGLYLRPEISLSVYSVKSPLMYTTSSLGGALNDGGPRETSTMFAVLLNIGKQWIINDRFLIDWYGGIGYATGHSYQDLGWHFAFVGGVPSFPIAVTTGIRIGVLF